MKRTDLDPLSPDIESLLASERVPVVQPVDVRHRALVRARAAMSGISTRPRATARLGGFRWGFAGGAILVAATLSAAAIEVHRRAVVSTSDPARAALPNAEPVPPAILAHPENKASQAIDPANGPDAVRAAPSPRAPTVSELYGLELKVLQPAHAAIGRGDFASALSAIADHEHRFPSGQLAEEREAMRVQALTAAHRTEDAHRAAAAFRKRFPQSVLLSRMKEPLQTTP
jgi:TolA-binding protein